MHGSHLRPVARVLSVSLATVLAVGLAGAQTPVSAPKNSYTPAQDVELGRDAAAQVEQQLPLLRDDQVTSYVSSIGRRLKDAIPPQFEHPEFRYSFKVVDVREINAFALPGGPMYVNRGMIERSRNEGEVAGVMAHELSHVALRHGTAQATKATKYELGQIAGAVLGSIIGGRTGSIVAQGTQFGLGTAFLRFSREYERQADLLGAQIMARAGYDPRDMANMFRTIEQESGPGGPQWLSDHPNPGDRYQYIMREAQSLPVRDPIRDTRGFQDTQARLRGMTPAPTTEAATRGARGGSSPSSDGGRVTGRVEPPSGRYTTYTEGNAFRVSVPSNWRELPGTSAVTFAPDGAYGTVGRQSVFSHGMEIGLARNETHDLQTATDELIDGLGRGNANLRRRTEYVRASVGGRNGLRTILSNLSEATGQEEGIEVYTTLLRDGSLFYALGVAPSDSFSEYQNTFRRVVGSIKLANLTSSLRPPRR